jgi:hypothetical protein
MNPRNAAVTGGRDATGVDKHDYWLYSAGLVFVTVLVIVA